MTMEHVDGSSTMRPGPSLLDEILAGAPSASERDEQAFLGGWLGRMGATTAREVRFPSGVALPVAAEQRDGPGEEHHDPNGSGNPVLDVGGERRGLQLDRHFRVAEFAPRGDGARIQPDLVRCLQAIRDRTGRAVTITSGYRSYAYNAHLYRTRYNREPTRSRHISGQAADIRISGMTGLQIAKLALEACGCGLGLGFGSAYAHVDVRGTYARWSYLTGKAASDGIAELDRHRRAICP
jgi:hypothetical protein